MANRKLKAPKGTDEANIGGESFRVDNDGTIEVPEELVAPLLDRGGFVDLTPPPQIPDGHVSLMHDDPDASCSIGDKINDCHIVPAAAAADLIASHGFKPFEPAKAASTPLPESPFVATTTTAQELKQDGPTVAEFVAAGYKASAYPPSGYATKSTQEEIDAAVAAESAMANAQ